MAARISTASSPSRNTMIAELVTTVALFALSPSVAAESAQLAVQHQARVADVPLRRMVCDQLGEPGLARAPNHISPSTSSASPGSNAFRRRSGPNSKNA